MKSFLLSLLVLASTLLWPASAAWAQACGATHIVHVSPTGGAEPTAGSSWGDPASLQHALGQANGDTDLSHCYDIRLMQGLYTPTASTNDRNAHFAINRPVMLRGGYTGNGDLRVSDVNTTVLSGDIDNNDSNKTPEGITPDANNIAGQNSHHVVVIGGLSFTQGNGVFLSAPGSAAYTLIERLTITAGRADTVSSSPILTEDGGGLVCNGLGRNCSPHLLQVQFLGNRAARFGGAMLSQGLGQPVIDNSLFSGNRADRGGAIFSFGENVANQPQIHASRFLGNHTFGTNDGGAIYHLSSGVSSTPRISDSLFRNNTARRGGAIANEIVGSGTLAPVLERNTFDSNRVGTRNWNLNGMFFGGAIFNLARGGAAATVSASLIQNTFTGNSAEQRGGAIYNQVLQSTRVDVHVVHNTFLQNEAAQGQAIYNQVNSGSINAQVSESILWGTGAFSQTDSSVPAGAVQVSRSIIVPGSHTGTGNLNLDPLLGTLQDHGGFTPTLLPGAGSPAIDTVACTSALATDQRGVARPQGSGATPCDIGTVEASDARLLQLQASGVGIVTGNPGLSCGQHIIGVCAASYPPASPPVIVTLEAQPDPLHLVTWSGDCTVDTVDPLRAHVTMDAAKICQVVFLHESTLSFDMQGGDPIAPITQGQNTTVILPAGTRSGYTFIGWNTAADGSGSAYAAGDSFTFPAMDTTLYAQWAITQFSVSASVSPVNAGIITADPPGTPLPLAVAHGDSASFIITPDAGFHIVAPIDGDCPAGPLVDNNYSTGPITADCSVVANLALNQYNVTFRDWDGTTFDSQTVAHGSAATAPADPVRIGYTFSGWDLPFDQVTADLTVTAQYSLNQYTVRASVSGGNGSVSPASQVVEHGESTSFIITPDAGYHVVQPLGGDCPAGMLTGNSHVIAAITGNCELIVSFAQNAAGSIAVHGGDAQATPVLAAFSAAFAVRVTDSADVPLQGITVSFAAPMSGASAVLSAATAITDVQGIASLDATANAIGGNYVVQANVGGVTTPASFMLENTALTATLALSVSPTPVPPGGTVTLTAMVTGDGALTPGGTVDFLINGAMVCAAVPVDASGIAICEAGPLAPGNHNATADYSGDDAHAPASTGGGIGFGVASPAPVMVPVNSFWAMLALIALIVLIGLPLNGQMRR